MKELKQFNKFLEQPQVEVEVGNIKTFYSSVTPDNVFNWSMSSIHSPDSLDNDKSGKMVEIDHSSAWIEESYHSLQEVLNQAQVILNELPCLQSSVLNRAAAIETSVPVPDKSEYYSFSGFEESLSIDIKERVRKLESHQEKDEYDQFETSGERRSSLIKSITPKIMPDRKQKLLKKIRELKEDVQEIKNLKQKYRAQRSPIITRSKSKED